MFSCLNILNKWEKPLRNYKIIKMASVSMFRRLSTLYTSAGRLEPIVCALSKRPQPSSMSNTCIVVINGNNS